MPLIFQELQMKFMTNFEKAGEGDQKRFLELPRVKARQLKMKVKRYSHVCFLVMLLLVGLESYFQRVPLEFQVPQ